MAVRQAACSAMQVHVSACERVRNAHRRHPWMPSGSVTNSRIAGGGRAVVSGSMAGQRAGGQLECHGTLPADVLEFVAVHIVHRKTRRNRLERDRLSAPRFEHDPVRGLAAMQRQSRLTV